MTRNKNTCFKIFNLSYKQKMYSVRPKIALSHFTAIYYYMDKICYTE